MSDGGDRQARMLERFKGMSPDEQKQFIERIKGRGGDTSVFEKATAPAAKSKGEAESPATNGATTIDALFAPLPTVERPGRAWLYVEKQLKPVNLRTGITDGTNTEVISGDLQIGHGSRHRHRPADGAARGRRRERQPATSSRQGNRGGNFGGGDFRRRRTRPVSTDAAASSPSRTSSRRTSSARSKCARCAA